ncbi:replication initiation protein [Priestia megaterium]|uniref:RepB family plasmid replication initiator protein n=1 Tax=Priestia megaterium TaxID=1404 RepID=A0A6M6E1J7_PRIMG|nr:replication initiation protein [Priestia megaterium]QJX80921.1 RepB family plasmid replication initiator protein [Priestia megaterium]
MKEVSRDLVLKNNNLVTKANSLIEMSYRLGVTEQKILLCIASNIKPTDQDFQTYTLSIKDFCKVIGSTSRNAYAEVDKITQNLMDKSFVFYNSEEKRTRINWLSKATYNTNEGTVTVRFDPDLKPFFLALSEKFTRYKLKNILNLRSSHSIRMFELLKSYEGLSERTFTVDELREKLGLEGKYDVWNNFKQRVLQHTQKEIEAKTDISFTFVPLKKGRTVEKVKFLIKANPSKSNSNLELKSEVIEVVQIDEEPELMEIHQASLRSGVNIGRSKIKEWLVSHKKDSIIEAIKMVGIRKNIKYPVPYITKILDAQAKEVIETIELDPIEQMIQEFIYEKTPKKKMKVVKALPDFLIEMDAIEKFAGKLPFEEAVSLWEKRKADIISIIRENRKNAQITY